MLTIILQLNVASFMTQIDELILLDETNDVLLYFTV